MQQTSGAKKPRAAVNASKTESFSLAAQASGKSLRIRLLPAVPPGPSIFVRMQGNKLCIRAVCAASKGTGAISDLVCDDHGRDCNGIHAVLQPVVLAPALPAQVLAGLFVFLVGTNRLLRHHFQ